jgi:hypothetical protein
MGTVWLCQAPKGTFDCATIKGPSCFNAFVPYCILAGLFDRLCLLCKILGFHAGDYEECRLLGYKTPVHTSQETHSVSATESSQLMLCKI